MLKTFFIKINFTCFFSFVKVATRKFKMTDVAGILFHQIALAWAMSPGLESSSISPQKFQRAQCMAE